MKSNFIPSISVFILFFFSHSIVSGQVVENLIARYDNLQKTLEQTTEWPSFDKVTMQIERDSLDAILGELPDGDNLAEQDMINRDLLKLVLEDRIFHIDWNSYEMPLNAEGGFLTSIVYNINGMQIRDSISAEKYLAKLNALPAYIDLRIGHMKAGQKRGVSSPKLITNLCLEMVDKLLETPAMNSFLFAPANGSSIDEEALLLIRNKVIPAYRKLQSFLRNEYLPNAPEVIGISHILTGKEFYEQRARYFTTDDYTPQEIFDIGTSEVKRIRSEMDQIIADLEFEGSFEDFVNFLRTDEQFYAKSPEEILQKAAWITKEMEGELPKYFNLLPRMPLTVKPVPAAIAPNYTSGRYSPGSYKNHKAGQYWVNTTKLNSRPLYALPALSLHEGVPGHHTQIMLAAEMELSDFRRQQYLSAFGEGWALYCEYLGKEAGIYHTPYEDFGRLVYEMWRACRLVVDPGMHYMGWDREKAFEFMKENTALSIHEINTEINRYIGWPGQAVSYKIGELKIKELRKLAESELGDHFDIKDFHDVILSNGSIPMGSLEKVVKGYIGEVER